jgi:hypothetical protein
MSPRKSHWIFFVVGLAVLCLALAAPAAYASREYAELAPGHPGGDCNFEPPQGGPSGGGTGDGGDPDDYSNLFRAPHDPTLDPVGGSRVTRFDVRRSAVWTDPMLHVVLIWLGIER